MSDIINNLYDLIVLLQMETGNVPDLSNNISVLIGLQLHNVIYRQGTDEIEIQYNGNIVLSSNINSDININDIMQMTYVYWECIY